MIQKQLLESEDIKIFGVDTPRHRKKNKQNEIDNAGDYISLINTKNTCKLKNITVK